MTRLVLKAIAVLGVAAFLLSVAMLYVEREQKVSPMGEEPRATRPSATADAGTHVGQEPGPSKPSIATDAETHAGRWVGGMYMFPIGPCTMIVKAAGSYWFTLPHDETRYYSDDIDSAKESASTACDDWYANEMAGRLLVQRANEELQKRHPTPHMADLGKPLFTRDGALVCPSWEALEYAFMSRLDGWKRTNALLGVKDPVAASLSPKVGQPVTAEFYGCTIYKDGIPVQMKATGWTGAGPETSVGWLDPMGLRN